MFRWWNLISKLYNHAQWLSTTFYSFCLCVSKLGINEVGGESGATFCICQYIDKWTNTGAFELAFQLLPHQSEQPHWDILLNILINSLTNMLLSVNSNRVNEVDSLPHIILSQSFSCSTLLSFPATPPRSRTIRNERIFAISLGRLGNLAWLPPYWWSALPDE